MFAITVGAGEHRVRIEPIDVMVFDGEGKVSAMKAYWSPANVTQVQGGVPGSWKAWCRAIRAGWQAVARRPLTSLLLVRDGGRGRVTWRWPAWPVRPSAEC